MSQDVNDWGFFVPTTTVFDIESLQGDELGPDEIKELIIQIYQTINNLAMLGNNKTTGFYFTQPFNTGQNLFDVNNNFNLIRPMFRIVVDFGALPAAGTKSVAHGIPNVTSTFSFVKIYGSATNPLTITGIPIPYSSATAIASNLELTVDATNVNITTGGTDYSAYTKTYVVLEYVQY